MREIELKSVVDDWEGRQARLRDAGAQLVFSGALIDKRYDTVDRSLDGRDCVLRLRVQRDEERTRTKLDWKGPTSYDAGYKVREEISLRVEDPAVAAELLERLGYVVTLEIEREIVVYDLAGAVIRFERYPRMDDLVEVEGEPEAIERAVKALGMPRDGFTPDRLADFARRYEERIGKKAALCDRDAAEARR
jgi:predicted adenylyl cyclase CyaB